MFNIAAPFGPGAGPDRTGAAAGTLLTGGATGHCTMDTFQVTGSGGASPVICGSNDGQHCEFTVLIFVGQYLGFIHFFIPWCHPFKQNQC